MYHPSMKISVKKQSILRWIYHLKCLKRFLNMKVFSNKEKVLPGAFSKYCVNIDVEIGELYTERTLGC